MKKSSVVIAFALFGLWSCAKEGDTIISPNEVQNQIHVVGSATIEAAPDIAQVQLGVQTFAETLDEAMAENNQRADGVIAALKAGGVAEADIKTTSFNVYPQRDFRKEDGIGEIVGYWVNNSVAATLRDLNSVGRLLEGAIEAGANNVNSLAFTLDDFEAVRAEARVKAMENAQERAASLAQAAGMELGKPIRIDEVGYGGGPIYNRGDYDEAMGADIGQVPVAPGELVVTAQVDVYFEIH
jgi:uncharacterized protein